MNASRKKSSMLLLFPGKFSEEGEEEEWEKEEADENEYEAESRSTISKSLQLQNVRFQVSHFSSPYLTFYNFCVQ